MREYWDSIYKGLLDTKPEEFGFLLTLCIALVSLAMAIVFFNKGLRFYKFGKESLADPNNEIFSKRYDFLDFIRAIAIIMVMVFHIWQQSWMWPTFYIGDITINLNHFAVAGFMGVEALFVLSGFCLFLPYAKSCFTGKDYKVSPWTFYKKRLLRIVPSYFLSIALLLLFDKTVNIGVGPEFWRNLINHLLFIENLTIQKGCTYINFVYWSLAVEMQFYILFPFIAWLMKRQPHLTTLGFLLVSNVYRANILLNKVDQLSVLFNMLPGMLDLFVLGMYGSWWAMRLKAGTYSFKPGTKLAFKTIMSLGFIAFSAVLSSILYWLMQFNYYNTGFTAVGGNQLFQTLVRPFWGILVMLQMICGVFLFKWIEKIIACKPVKFMARISLNLYLWHQWISVKLRVNNVFHYDILNYEVNQFDPEWGKKAFWGSIVVAIIVAYLFTLVDEWLVEKIPQLGKLIGKGASIVKQKLILNKKEEAQ
ncbi:MAG: acyltransferase [Clostridia bacterium]|nr:acyltransferase [Clostridia bacterium]